MSGDKLKRYISYLLFFVSFAFGYYAIDQGYVALSKNVSESIPHKYFIATKAKLSATQGRYVSFNHPSNERFKLLKQVKGVAGDVISVRDGEVFVNNENCGALMSYGERLGIALHPIQEGKIPEGYIYAHAPHPESFDSRYEEFGLIKTKDIDYILWRLF